MDLPTVEQLVAYMGPMQSTNAALQECLDVAIELVEHRIGPLADRTTGEATAREALFTIAKHLYGVRQNPSNQSAMYASGDYPPGPGGYLIPNRAASLLDTLWATDPSSIGIG